ncbi:transcription termination/antitermination factor NusG, partial [Xanthomonas citri pv. citri]|nr:transcription termination/antitermination factor NusG [Xanthomonas citri pv. citri]
AEGNGEATPVPLVEVEVSEEAAKDQVDPVAEFKANLRRQEGDWFVIHTYAGYENRVKTNLETRIQSLNMEEDIFQIEVPMEEVVEI